MEEPGQGSRLVRPGLVCQPSSATTFEPFGSAHARLDRLAGDAALTRADLFNRLRATIAELDVGQAREETSRFIRDPSTLAIGSPDFFLELADKIETI